MKRVFVAISIRVIDFFSAIVHGVKAIKSFTIHMLLVLSSIAIVATFFNDLTICKMHRRTRGLAIVLSERALFLSYVARINSQGLFSDTCLLRSDNYFLRDVKRKNMY